jgi:hypothetical protein
MNSPRLAVIVLALFGGLFFAPLAVALADQPATLPVPLEVRAELVSATATDAPRTIFVTLHNQSPTSPLTSVVVKAGSQDTAEVAHDAFDLQPGQTRVERFDLRATEANPYVLASFKWNGQEHSLATTMVLPPAASTLWPLLLPILNTLLSTLLGGVFGAWLVNYFTQKRERARADFEWSKMVFDKYEAAYRGFLTGWQNLSSAQSLTTDFNALSNTAYVPPRIRDSYAKTLDILSDAGRTLDQKRQAGEKFKGEVEGFMKDPLYK